MTTKELERILKPLANRRRIAILKVLDKQIKVSVGDIAKEIKLSLKSTSRHLALLFIAEIVEREQVNINVFYSLAKPLHPLTRQVLSCAHSHE